MKGNLIISRMIFLWNTKYVQGSSHSSYTSVQLLFPVRFDTLKKPRDPLKLEAWSPKDPIKTLMGALIKHLNVGCSATPGWLLDKDPVQCVVDEVIAVAGISTHPRHVQLVLFNAIVGMMLSLLSTIPQATISSLKVDPALISEPHSVPKGLSAGGVRPRQVMKHADEAGELDKQQGVLHCRPCLHKQFWAVPEHTLLSPGMAPAVSVAT